MKGRRRASRSVAWTLAFGQPEDRTPTEVRFRGQTGKHFFILSFTGFGPNPT
jgi:hypothetical protein